jgi:hypothetical protein
MFSELGGPAWRVSDYFNGKQKLMRGLLPQLTAGLSDLPPVSQTVIRICVHCLPLSSVLAACRRLLWKCRYTPQKAVFSIRWQCGPGPVGELAWAEKITDGVRESSGIQRVPACPEQH